MLFLSKEEGLDAKGALLQQSGLRLIKLPHPKGGIPVMFLQGGDAEIYELQNAAPRKHASWFINQRVSSDPSFYMASRVDPRFLVLPYLEKAGSKFSPLDQIVTVADSCARISLDKASTWGLDGLCDIKDLGDMILYRHNEAKTLEWLGAKVRKTARLLTTQRIKKDKASNGLFVGAFNVSAQSAQSAASAAAADAVPIEVTDEQVSQEETRVSLQIVCDYLTDTIATKLVQSFGMQLADLAPSKVQENQLKRKADWESELELEKETLAYAMKPTSSAGTSSATASSSSSSSSSSSAAKKKAPTKGKEVKPVAGKQAISSFFSSSKK